MMVGIHIVCVALTISCTSLFGQAIVLNQSTSKEALCDVFGGQLTTIHTMNGGVREGTQTVLENIGNCYSRADYYDFGNWPYVILNLPKIGILGGRNFPAVAEFLIYHGDVGTGHMGELFVTAFLSEPVFLFQDTHKIDTMFRSVRAYRKLCEDEQNCVPLAETANVVFKRQPSSRTIQNLHNTYNHFSNYSKTLLDRMLIKQIEASLYQASADNTFHVVDYTAMSVHQFNMAVGKIMWSYDNYKKKGSQLSMPVYAQCDGGKGRTGALLVALLGVNKWCNGPTGNGATVYDLWADAEELSPKQKEEVREKNSLYNQRNANYKLFIEQLDALANRIAQDDNPYYEAVYPPLIYNYD